MAMIEYDQGPYSLLNRRNTWTKKQKISYFPALELDGGTFAGSPSTGILTITGTNTGPIAPMAMYFSITQSATGTAYIGFGQTSFGLTTGGGAYGYYIKLNANDLAASGTYLKYGFVHETTLISAATGGNHYDIGLYSKYPSILAFPLAATGINFSIIGARLERSSLNILNLGGGSWNNVTAYGLQITGWGSTDTTTGVAGTFTSYAIYIDGGNCLLGKDNAKWIFGTGADASIYYNGTDLIIDPDEVGAGTVKIGAAANNTLDAGAYSVGGVAGANFNGAVTNITVVNGIVTAAS